METLWIPGSLSKTASDHSVQSPEGPRVSILPKMRNLSLREESKGDPGDRASCGKDGQVEVRPGHSP